MQDCDSSCGDPDHHVLRPTMLGHEVNPKSGQYKLFTEIHAGQCINMNRGNPMIELLDIYPP